MRSLRAGLLSLLFAGLASAQWSAPVLGLVHDPQDRSLRLIQGVPGAARISRPLANEVDLAWVAPDGQMALLLSGERLSLVSTNGSSYPLSLSEWMGRPTAAAWSADASVLALHFKSCECVRTMRRPTRQDQQPADLASFPAAFEQVQALAVTGDADFVVASTGEGLWKLRSGRMPELVFAASFRFMAFGRDGRLYALEGDAPIMRAGHIRGDETTHFEAYPVEIPEASNLTGFALGRDQRELIAVDQDAARILRFHLGSGTLSGAISGEGPVEMLVPLSARHFIVAAGTASEPARVVEAGEELRLFYVPARGEN